MVNTRASTTPARARATVEPFSADSTRPFSDKIAYLLSTDPSLELKQALASLFATMGITEWEDFAVHTDEDFNTTTVADQSVKDTITASHVKRLSVICLYAQLEPYNDATTFHDMVRYVTRSRTVPVSSTPLPPVTPMPAQPTLPVPFLLDSLADSAASTATSKALKDVPDLKSFSGAPEDYRNWADKTLDTLGRCLLDDYCKHQETVDANPKVAHGVFCAISASLRNGLAKSHVDELKAANDFNPFKLWNKVEEYYNTPLNKTLTLISQMRRLMDLRLDGNTSPTSFITDWKDAVLKISEVNPDIGSNHHLLRAMLFVAMSDEEYNPVRDDMIKDDSKDYYQILQAIREREEMLTGRDRLQALSSQHDGIRSRRSQTTSPPQSDGSGPAPDGRWYIPLFPKAWHSAFTHHSGWQNLLAWRSYAVRNPTTQEQLHAKYPQLVKSAKDTAGNSNPTSGRSHHSNDSRRGRGTKTRRATTTSSSTNNDVDTDHSSHQSEDDTSTSAGNRPRAQSSSKHSNKRIKLQHKSTSTKIKFERGA